MAENQAADEESKFWVNYWVDAECHMEVEASSEEEAIEKAKEAINQRMYYGDVSPAGEPKSFQAREKND